MGSMDGSLYDDEDVRSMEEDEDRSVKEEPMMVPPKEYAYLNPPAHVCSDDVVRPPFVLMEDFAYFADRDNTTTATCKMSGGRGDFKVTLDTAPPPLVSYLCVHATAFHHTEFAIEPQIMATEPNSGLLLLRVVIGDHHSDVMITRKREYFVYDVRSGTPSLTHLPHSGNLGFNETSLAIVRKCNKRSDKQNHDVILRPHGHGASEEDDHNCDYVVAAQCHGFGYVKHSELCLYHSDTGTWSKEPVVAKSYPDHCTCKTITIGGDKGTVAWVDLSRNIVYCDVLDKRPRLRYRESEQLDYGDPRTVRDVALVDGRIRYVDLKPRVQPGLARNSECTYHGWEARIWSINTSSSSAKDWNADYQLDSSQIPESSLPKLNVSADVAARPTLSSLQIGLPNLSLQDDGIVYFLTKIDHRDKDHIAWVLAVDMRNKTIQKVAEQNCWFSQGLQCK
ncbi:hypothetical protein ACQ4PT_027000 [Festuca glaucescens]